MRRSDDDRRQALGAVRVESVRVESVAGDSPVEAAVPFWITACVLLMPPRRRNGEEISATLANAVFPVVQTLIADRLRTDPDAAAPLDRDRIARRAGLSSGKKAGWVFDYLELVGGLRVHRHYPEPGRGREADTFTVFTRPPLNYIGPRTHAELEHALDHPDRLLAGHLFLDPDAGQPQGSGSGTFTGTLDGMGSGSGTFTGGSAGQPQGSGSGTFTDGMGSGSGTFTGGSAGQPQGSGSGTFSSRERASLSLREERESEGAIEPVPGRSAQPPATGPHAAGEDSHGRLGQRGAVAVLSRPELDPTDTTVELDQLTAALTPALTPALTTDRPAPAGLEVGGQASEIRTLVRRLPWAAWAQTRKPGWRLTAADADQVHTAITDAITTKGLTLDQATELGLAALSEATSSQPVTYVVNAFTRHLSRRLRALHLEPLHTDPLHLPTTQTPSDRPTRHEPRTRARDKAATAKSAQQATQAQHEARQDTATCPRCDEHGYIPAPTSHTGYTAVTRCTHDTTRDATAAVDDATGDVADSQRSTTAGRAAALALFRNRTRRTQDAGAA